MTYRLRSAPLAGLLSFCLLIACGDDDAGPDSGADVGLDAAVDVELDTPTDTAADTPADSAADTTADTASDTAQTEITVQQFAERNCAVYAERDSCDGGTPWTDQELEACVRETECEAGFLYTAARLPVILCLEDLACGGSDDACYHQPDGFEVPAEASDFTAECEAYRSACAEPPFSDDYCYLGIFEGLIEGMSACLEVACDEASACVDAAISDLDACFD